MSDDTDPLEGAEFPPGGAPSEVQPLSERHAQVVPVKEPRYLGDGVYILPWYCPGAFILRTGDHREGECTDEIYIEPEVLRALLRYVQPEPETTA